MTMTFSKERREKLRQKALRQPRDTKGRFVKLKPLPVEPPRMEEPIPFGETEVSERTVHVLIHAEYRLPRAQPAWPHIDGFNYDNEDVPAYVDRSIATNPNALQIFLNAMHTEHVHYRARVVEYI